MESQKTHLFTESGLGAAPFVVVGYWSMPEKSLVHSNPSFYQAEMAERPAAAKGICDHCGRAITHHCLVRSAEGKLSAVGLSCAKRSGDSGLVGKAELKKKEEKKVRDLRLRQMRFEQLMEEQRKAYCGLTEVEFNQACNQRYLGAIRRAAKPVLDVLSRSDSRFCREMKADLERGYLPFGRAAEVVREIALKSLSADSYEQTMNSIKTLSDEGWKGFQDATRSELLAQSQRREAA